MFITKGEFIDALLGLNMNVSSVMIIPDGVIRRVHINGHKAASKNGWFFYKGDFGMFGDFKSGIEGMWQGKGLLWAKAPILPATQNIEELQKVARTHANQILSSAQPEDGSHPYLIAKGVNSFGLLRAKDKLIVTLNDENGVVQSLQFISENGTKRFLKNGRKKGCYFMLGKTDGAVLCIAEGYATAASIHQATTYPVAVAFDAGNLLPVGEALRRKFPDITLIFCADDDLDVQGNPGLSKAKEAADKTGGIVLTPTEGKCNATSK